MQIRLQGGDASEHVVIWLVLVFTHAGFCTALIDLGATLSTSVLYWRSGSGNSVSSSRSLIGSDAHGALAQTPISTVACVTIR